MAELPTPHELSDLRGKVDNAYQFDARERRVLLQIIDSWESAAGFIKVTKTVGLVLAFTVLVFTQWDRLGEILGRGRP